MYSSFKPIYLFLLVFGLFFMFVIGEFFLSREIKVLTHNKYMHTSNSLKEQINEAIKNKTSSTLNIAISLSENSGYKEFLKNGKEFKIDLKNISAKIKKHSNFKNVWIHLIDKDGISRYRSWSPKKDDNVSLIRKELPILLKNPKIS